MSLHTPTSDPFALRPRQAWAALRALLANPEETQQVFTIVRALSGKTLLRGYNRFTRTATGRAVLAEKRELIEVLQNRDYLRALPEGSLGRHYLAFVERENLTAEGLKDASAAEQTVLNPQIGRYAARLRDMHDLWHVTCGYGRDVSGEACLLAFTVAQTRNPGLALIVVAGTLKIARVSGDRRIFRAAWSAFRAGRRAAWLPAADWEGLLALPLQRVRDELAVGEPTVYRQLRTTMDLATP
ncbi:MAG: Coq4 family protein [Pseudomonadales bacterium]